MLFNSIQYAIFLPVVLGLYWLMSHKAQNRLLLVASYVFYGAWDYRFLSLLMLSTCVDFTVGHLLGRSYPDRTRKRILVISVFVNLGILAAFKYYGFFVDSAMHVLDWMGLHPNPPLLQVLLPVGISFYTFQTMSYTIDVYRRRIEPAESLFTFACYVAYFPQLVAGPIERAKHLLPQIQKPRARPTGEQFRSGAFLILLGLFKKVAVADAVAPIAARAFGAGSAAGSLTLLVGMVAFSLQIYGDFSGYSDIARGTSRLFGIELVRNFEQPYLSRSITEFWRTWHISLSNWLHDYLYVPLGGNRRGKASTYRNLLLTMLLGGLWHGASWTFVAWGGLHGLLLAGHRAIGGYVPRGAPSKVKWREAPKILATFASVSLLWVFFRADTLASAFDFFRGLFRMPSALPALNDVIPVAVGLLLLGTIDIAQRTTAHHAVVLRWPAIARGVTYAVLLMSVVMWSGGEAKPFIYFQF